MSTTSEPTAHWEIFYWTRDGLRARWVRNIVGHVEARDIDTALRIAGEEYGSYREVGYRLRARRALASDAA